MSGLYALKPWYTRRLSGITGFAVRRDISPDVFTAVGVLGAVAAGLFIWQGWWLPTLLALAVRLGGANLDGAVARARGVSRPWGFVLNEIGDRTSDFLAFAGLAALAARLADAWLDRDVVLVLVAAAAATLPTLVSLAAAGAGATRRNGGPFGKTERCAALVVATAFTATIPWVAGVVIAGSVITALVRLLAAHRELTGAAG
jgi:CDP-diacylglycerol--glycerol-3-phosphate 3-phosphatidyltransferase